MTDQPTTRQPLTNQQLNEIEKRATSEHLTPGPWTIDREWCDCSDGYCSHGPYVTGIVTPVPNEIAAERLVRTGEKPHDYDFHRSEIGDFTEADCELMAHARADVPALIGEVRRLQQSRRTLTPTEYDAAWHAVEGAAGEPGADPGTILHAVLDRLGIATPDA